MNSSRQNDRRIQPLPLNDNFQSSKKQFPGEISGIPPRLRKLLHKGKKWSDYEQEVKARRLDPALKKQLTCAPEFFAEFEGKQRKKNPLSNGRTSLNQDIETQLFHRINGVLFMSDPQRVEMKVNNLKQLIKTSPEKRYARHHSRATSVPTIEAWEKEQNPRWHSQKTFPANSSEHIEGFLDESCEEEVSGGENENSNGASHSRSYKYGNGSGIMKLARLESDGDTEYSGSCYENSYGHELSSAGHSTIENSEGEYQMTGTYIERFPRFKNQSKFLEKTRSGRLIETIGAVEHRIIRLKEESEFTNKKHVRSHSEDFLTLKGAEAEGKVKTQLSLPVDYRMQESRSSAKQTRFGFSDPLSYVDDSEGDVAPHEIGLSENFGRSVSTTAAIDMEDEEEIIENIMGDSEDLFPMFCSKSNEWIHPGLSKLRSNEHQAGNYDSKSQLHQMESIVSEAETEEFTEMKSDLREGKSNSCEILPMRFEKVPRNPRESPLLRAMSSPVSGYETSKSKTRLRAAGHSLDDIVSNGRKSEQHDEFSRQLDLVIKEYEERLLIEASTETAELATINEEVPIAVAIKKPIASTSAGKARGEERDSEEFCPIMGGGETTNGKEADLAESLAGDVAGESSWDDESIADLDKLVKLKRITSMESEELNGEINPEISMDGFTEPRDKVMKARPPRPVSQTRSLKDVNFLSSSAATTSELDESKGIASNDDSSTAGEEIKDHEVWVNGQLLSNEEVEKAEFLAGPIEPGNYWYDSRAGFWGVMGGPCMGIIPAGIKEFPALMDADCAGGATRVWVNGRQLHKKDLMVLKKRGLAQQIGANYFIDPFGRVFSETNGELVQNLGKLQPSLEKLGRGLGMFPL